MDCLHVLELLSDEAKAKTFFGGYSSAIVRDWHQLEQLYRKGNLHIVDAGRYMVQGVQYDM